MWNADGIFDNAMEAMITNLFKMVLVILAVQMNELMFVINCNVIFMIEGDLQAPDTLFWQVVGSEIIKKATTAYSDLNIWYQ